MTIAFIGLGRMGYHMVERLLLAKHRVIAYNRSPEKVQSISKKGAIAAYSLNELISKFKGRRIIWLMLPAGKVTDDTIKNLLPKLKKGDIIINGANSYYKNAQRQSKLCGKYGVHLFDAGVSGGIWGLKRGYALMVGGPQKQFKIIEPYCKTLAPKQGYGYFGAVGMGHYTKSVHNIVEYTMMQGLAEGVELLDKKGIDYLKAAKTWQPASIVTSSLLDWMVDSLQRPDFKKISTHIGSVTIKELRATKGKEYAPAFDVAASVREIKGKKFSLGRRVIAAIRREFGGHFVRKSR
jgi:6-phosphogluconate dehydrogenase